MQCFLNLFNMYVIFQSFKTKITKKYISASVIMLLKILQNIIIIIHKQLLSLQIYI